ncbi:Delta 8 Fatty Acid Desaturase [Perkinsus olseni]|uniref:Delta 8 Fatty Acid Desaturase n=1 Tax=Perkinsus olseni TaxID=32597 RepID=A0A7J6LWX4_PEROL|nr:Delta 8 Fatty Acid Desaturase [Perkinsus olseni]
MLFARFNLYIQSVLLLTADKRTRLMKGVKSPKWELCALAGFATWYIYLVTFLPSPATRIAFVLLSHSVAGVLHIQITLSHFAMPTYEVSQRPLKVEAAAAITDKSDYPAFLSHQLKTSLDITCPWWMDWFHGGLQFQAAHHAFSIIATCNSLTFNVPEDTQVDITKLELSRLGQDYCMMEDYTVYRAGRVVVCLGLRSGTNHLLYAYNEKEDVVVMLAQAMTKEKKIPKSIRFGINTRLYFGRDHLKLCDEALKLLLVHVPGEYLWSDTWSYRFWRGMFSLGLFALPHKETILIPHPRERYCVDLPSNPEAWVRGKKMRKYGNSFQLSVNMDFEMDLTLCALYHEKVNQGTWLDDRCLDVLLMMREDPGGPQDLRFVAWELRDVATGNIAALSMGFILGSVFHDFTASTPIRDHRSAGRILLQVEGHMLTLLGVKLWYLGFPMPYMRETLDDLGGRCVPRAEFIAKWHEFSRTPLPRAADSVSSVKLIKSEIAAGVTSVCTVLIITIRPGSLMASSSDTPTKASPTISTPCGKITHHNDDDDEPPLSIADRMKLFERAPPSEASKGLPKAPSVAPQTPSLARSLGGGRDHCFVCTKAVYANDTQFRVDGEVYHQHCFKCSSCDVQLNLRNWSPGPEVGRVVCSSCYKNEFYKNNSYTRGGPAAAAVNNTNRRRSDQQQASGEVKEERSDFSATA